MRPVTYAIGTLAVLIFALGGFLAFSAGRVEAALAEMQRSRSARVSTPDPAPLAPRTPAVSTAPAVSLPVAKSSPAQPWQPPPSTAEERQRMMANALPSSPQSRAAREGIRVRLHFHALYGQLGLNAAQIAQFEAAVVAQGGGSGIFNSIVASPDDQRLLLESLAKQLDKTVGGTLGESAVAPVRDFVATSELREVAEKLAVHTFYTDTPLTAAQSDQLVQIFRECRTDSTPVVRIDPDSVDWTLALQRAESVLSPAQMTALRALTDFRLFDQEFKRSTGLPYRRPIRNF